MSKYIRVETIYADEGEIKQVRCGGKFLSLDGKLPFEIAWYLMKQGKKMERVTASHGATKQMWIGGEDIVYRYKEWVVREAYKTNFIMADLFATNWRIVPDEN